MSKNTLKQGVGKGFTFGRGQHSVKPVTVSRRATTGQYVKRSIDPDTGLYIIPVEDLDKVPG